MIEGSMAGSQFGYRANRRTAMLTAGCYQLYPGVNMPHDTEFQGCDATTVFAEVSSAADSEEVQSLWDRLFQEMEKRRVDGAVSYLLAEFQRLADSMDRELTRLEAE